jgi:bifunctional UDP-N-acetylglucosamine pyrophosphorylase / glucosamine-1-phosphate N-acetyltransferase
VRNCTVIPAAGKGTRLGLDVPKILAPVTGDETIWSIMQAKLTGVTDHINVVMSPWGEPVFRSRISPQQHGFVSVSIQTEPVGMGDAVFRAEPVFADYDLLTVVWGDQVNISRDTLKLALAQHGGRPNTAIIPIVRLAEPYVEYRFSAGRLTRILETREGDVCAPGGFGDVGTFVLSVPGLKDIWLRYLGFAGKGAQTGEINFLPFLRFLSETGWTVEPVEIANPVEARGINTKADLAHAAQYVEELKSGRVAGSGT